MSEAIIIILLIAFSGFLSLAEMALISARKSSIQTDSDKGDEKAKRVLRLLSDPDKFLSTVQIGVTLVGILTGIFSGDKIADEFAIVFERWGMTASGALSLSKTIIVIIVTFLSLIFAELLPKRIGLSSPERYAKSISGTMRFLNVIMSPAVWLASKTTHLIFRALRLSDHDTKVTEEEIKNIIQESIEDGEVTHLEQDIVENVFALGDLKVDTIMTYRSELVWLDINMDEAKVRSTIEAHLFEEYPVVNGDLDHVVGVLTLKDFVINVGKPDFNLANMIQEPVYFPETMSVYNVLEEMKKKRVSRALVCDEFGICSGIITLKDIIEGLVGDVNNDDKEEDIVSRGEDEGWAVDGHCPIYDFFKHFDLDDNLLSDTEFSTVAGLILEQLGRFPECGEKIVWNEFTFEVVNMDGVRIDKVIVTRQRQEPQSE